MIPPLDNFAATFDAIDIAGVRAPSRAAIESASTPSAPPPEEAPGFYLLDDAQGRFEIDRAIGVISLKDEGLLASERGAIHAVRLRVIEPSGARYEMDMQLRLTGRVPQMVGAEDLAALAGVEAPAPRVEAKAAAIAAPAQAAPTQWTRYAPATGARAKAPRHHGRRAFIAAEIPQAENLDAAALTLPGAPGPFAAHLPWSL
ncbi:MAG: hypothetical protein R3C25_01245 [Hyphomonadaceae bacterium]